MTHSTGAQDPHWVDVDDTILVSLNADEAVWFQRWLRSQGMCLERIPGAIVDAGQIYSIAMRDVHG
jgi:hypothetical protein